MTKAVQKVVPLASEFTVVGQHPIEKLDGTRLFRAQTAEVVQLNASAIQSIADLHVSVMRDLTDEEQSFMLGKSKKDFQALFANPENGVVGVVHDGALVAKAHMVCPTDAAPYGWHDGVKPVAEPSQMTVTQGVCVARSHRGNEFMVSMLRAWEDHARALGKTHLVAEAEIKNIHSVENFLSAGFTVHAAAIDAIDNAPVFVLAKNLTKAAPDINAYSELRLIAADDAAYQQHHDAVAAGFVGVAMTADYKSVIYGRHPVPGLYAIGR